MKPFTLIGSTILILVVLLTAAAFINRQEEVPEKHVEVVLRNLGHQVLLSAGDSSSRVMPVKKLYENRYQISFQHDFSVISDTLINLVQKEFQKNLPDIDYIVNLKTCTQNSTVLAFEINRRKGDVIACRGRKLQTGCYFIEIDFLKHDPSNFLWLLLLIIPLACVYWLSKNKFQKKEEQDPIADSTSYIQLGIFRFYTDTNKLKTELKTIELSEKETKALKIFAENINNIVEREKLMKEIWEDKGLVVISKNVDVLVSKLRKKLSDDSSIKFMTVPGRGYKFIIENMG